MIFQDIRTSIAKEPYIVCDFSGLLPPSGSAHVPYDSNRVLFLIHTHLALPNLKQHRYGSAHNILVLITYVYKFADVFRGARGLKFGLVFIYIHTGFVYASKKKGFFVKLQMRMSNDICHKYQTLSHVLVYIIYTL